jgi:hypothetical protein
MGAALEESAGLKETQRAWGMARRSRNQKMPKMPKMR